MTVTALTSAAVRAASTRVVVGAFAGVALLAWQAWGGLLPACPLRAMTGVPCPFCGSTTAALAFGQGDPVGALRTAPLLVLAGPVLLLFPALRPALQRVPPRWRRAGVVLALAFSEVWQLSRLGLL